MNVLTGDVVLALTESDGQPSFVPQLWQKLAPAGTTVSHFGHFLTGTLVG